MDTASSVIVGFDYRPEKDNAVLIVGKPGRNKTVDIINAFQGDEAKELWEKLTCKKTNGGNGSEAD